MANSRYTTSQGKKVINRDQVTVPVQHFIDQHGRQGENNRGDKKENQFPEFFTGRYSFFKQGQDQKKQDDPNKNMAKIQQPPQPQWRNS